MNQVVESRGKKNKSEKLIDTNRNSVSVELVHSLLTSANFLSNYPRVDQKMEIAAILVDWNETENGKKKKKLHVCHYTWLVFTLNPRIQSTFKQCNNKKIYI